MKDLKVLIGQLSSEGSYEGTLSSCILEKVERKHTYVVKLVHKVSRLSYGYDSDRYLNDKKRSISRAKANFEDNLRKESYDFKRVEDGAYKVKKERNEKFK